MIFEYSPDSKLVGFSGITVHVPASAHPGFQGKGELREIDESLFTGIWGVIGQGLAHQVDWIEKAGGFQALLHQLDGLKRNEGVEVAVDSN